MKKGDKYIKEIKGSTYLLKIKEIKTFLIVIEGYNISNSKQKKYFQENINPKVLQSYTKISNYLYNKHLKEDEVKKETNKTMKKITIKKPNTMKIIDALNLDKKEEKKNVAERVANMLERSQKRLIFDLEDFQASLLRDKEKFDIPTLAVDPKAWCDSYQNILLKLKEVEVKLIAAKGTLKEKF